MPAPFFSVIVPVCNRLTFMAGGMDMLLGQSFSDFEIILVDDGSSDGSAEACDRAAEHERVRVIHRRNGGAGPARNAGLAAARGVWVCFCDIDDRVPADWLEKIYGHLADDSCEMLVFGYREHNPRLGTVAEFAFADKAVNTNRDLAAAYSETLSGRRFNNGFVWNKVYQRDFLLRHGIVFPDLRIQQDEVFNHNVYRRVSRVKLVSDVLYDYYVYDCGTGRSRTIPRRTEIFTAVRASFLALCDFWGLHDEPLLTYIHSRFIYNILYNRNRNGLCGLCLWADEVLSSKEVAESLSYLSAAGCGAAAGSVLRAAVARRSKPLLLLAAVCDTAVSRTKELCRNVLHALRRANRR